jgi:hypothetical protein
MKIGIYRQIFALHFLVFTFYADCFRAITDLPKTATTLSFKENKGQVSDQFYKPRPDILFSGTDGQLVFHLKKNGISYQLSRIDSWKKQEGITAIRHGKENITEPDQITVYRLDINWLNANTNSNIKKTEVIEGYDNYYLETCPQGALNVKSYKNITYQQLYTGIDLKWYEKNGNLKYDYLVAAGADHKQIQLEFNGAEKLSVNKKGELVIKTPLGELIEAAPFVTQNGKQLVAKWLINKNIVSYDIKNIDPALPDTWRQRIFLTFDIDWVCDAVLEDGGKTSGAMPSATAQPTRIARKITESIAPLASASTGFTGTISSSWRPKPGASAGGGGASSASTTPSPGWISNATATPIPTAHAVVNR